MKTPVNEIKVGAYTYTISPKDMAYSDQFELRGICNRNHKRIEYVEGFDNVTECETISHEILHAVTEFFGLDSSDCEEAFVNALSKGLVMFIRDNPMFSTWFVATVLEGGPPQKSIEGSQYSTKG